MTRFPIHWLRNTVESVRRPRPHRRLYRSPSWWLNLLQRYRAAFAISHEAFRPSPGPGYLVFTCDLELDPPPHGGSWAQRSDQGLRRGLPLMLDILNRHGVPATFFTEASLVFRYRSLIRNLEAQGHEIALHGYEHESYGGFYYRTKGVPPPRVLPVRLRPDYLLRGLHVLQECVSHQITAFRAPFLAISSDIGQLLHDTGIKIDSSLPNTFFGRLSTPYHPLPFQLDREQSSMPARDSLLEIPVSVDPRPHMAPHSPWRYLKRGQVHTMLRAVQVNDQLCSRVGMPLVLVLLYHPWEFSLRTAPAIVSSAAESCSFLDAFLHALVTQRNVQAITISDLGRLWETSHCRWHCQACSPISPSA